MLILNSAAREVFSSDTVVLLSQQNQYLIRFDLTLILLCLRLVLWSRQLLELRYSANVMISDDLSTPFAEFRKDLLRCHLLTSLNTVADFLSTQSPPASK